jgi:hypothetical protein
MTGPSTVEAPPGSNVPSLSPGVLGPPGLRIMLRPIASPMPLGFYTVAIAPSGCQRCLSAGGGTVLLDAIGAAVIGGVSLFGGRGRVGGVVLGSLVIANGTDVVGYSAAAQYIITAAILLAAVTLDSASRRRLAASGR